MSIQTINSSKNPLLKEYRKLVRSGRQRRKEKKIALEGPNLIRAALDNNYIPEVVFFSTEYFEAAGKDWLPCLPDATSQFIIPADVFKSIADTDSPQEVAAIVPFDYESSWSPTNGKLKLVLILDRLQDPGNMGTIIRTAQAAGVDRVYYSSGCVDLFNPKLLRSTAGAFFNLSFEPVDDLFLLFRFLKEKGIKIVSASLRSDLLYWSADLRPPLALIIGNETSGIDPLLEEASDIRVTIPLTGKVESLNAAVAAGIILFDIVRQDAGFCLDA